MCKRLLSGFFSTKLLKRIDKLHRWWVELKVTFSLPPPPPQMFYFHLHVHPSSMRDHLLTSITNIKCILAILRKSSKDIDSHSAEQHTKIMYCTYTDIISKTQFTGTMKFMWFSYILMILLAKEQKLGFLNGTTQFLWQSWDLQKTCCEKPFHSDNLTCRAAWCL